MMNTVQQLQSRTIVQSYRSRYREYVQTPHWKALRWEAIKEAGRICQSCGHNRRLEAHHRNYRNLTDCTVADLVVLCYRCHTYFHEALKVNATKPSMYSLEETVTLIHNYCRTQGIQLRGPVCTRPFRKLIQAAYNKCKGRLYSRKAVENLVIDLRAIVATMPNAVIVSDFTPFQKSVLQQVRTGRAYVMNRGMSPERQDELAELIAAGKLKRNASTGLLSQP